MQERCSKAGYFPLGVDVQIATTAALTGFDPTGIKVKSGPFFQRRSSLAALVTLGIRITAMSPEARFKTSAYLSSGVMAM